MHHAVACEIERSIAAPRGSGSLSVISRSPKPTP